MKSSIPLPSEPDWVRRRLEERGYEAYAVGGCVRDLLLGRTPEDWDFCTSALPEETAACFSDCRILETGRRHGTITVFYEGVSCEVTTYRRDGGYTDHRHPDQVQFVGNLNEDLSRRDFTINAMAYHPERGLVDLFGGQEDLQAACIRCVGEPERRFREDALRILRALRFASAYDFHLEKETARAIHQNRKLLGDVAPERLQAELGKLLLGSGVETVLLEFPDVLAVFLPEILPTVDFEQRHPHHQLDVWAHTAHAVAASVKDGRIRLALLLHDLGKPSCCTEDMAGICHFYGHAEKSAELAGTVLRRLRFDHHTQEQVVKLVKLHDLPLLPQRGSCLRWLNRMGEESLHQLIEVHRGDIRAQAFSMRKEQELAQFETCLREVLEGKACFSLEQLAVKGDDLLAVGIPPGKPLGGILRGLMESVLGERLPNQREELLREAISLWAHLQEQMGLDI